MVENRTSRTGLYVMVFLSMMVSCATGIRIERIEEMLERESQKPKEETRNVIRGEKPETFYEIDGQRYYSKIDGVPVEDYF